MDSRSIQNPNIPITAANILDYLGGSTSLSNSGVRVNTRSALSCSPVWQAVDVIAGDISRTPFRVYREDGRTRVPATEHPVYRLLNRSVGRMTSDLWLSRIIGHALLYGNGYSRVIWRGATVVELVWYPRDSVEPQFENGVHYYLVQNDPDIHGKGGFDRVPANDMIHLVGLTLDEYGGLSIIDYARNTIGRQLSGEGWADDFFSNYGMPAGWFQHPEEMSEPAQERFLGRVQARHSGYGNRWKTGILEEGMTWANAGVNPKDALLIEALGWGVLDVARFFNLPPHKLGDSSRVSYNSLEQEERAYRSSSLGKWFCRLQYAVNDACFLPSEQLSGYYSEFDQDRFTRPDTAARYQAYAIGVTNGILSPNECRAMEGLNPRDGGDEYLTPLTHASNTEPPEDEPEGEEPPETPLADEDQSRAILFDLTKDQLETAARLLGNAAHRAAKRGGNFLSVINGLDGRFRPAVEAKIRSAIQAAARIPINDRGELVERTAATIVGRAVDLFVTASECSPDNLLSRVDGAAEKLLADMHDLALEIVFKDQKNAA